MVKIIILTMTLFLISPKVIDTSYEYIPSQTQVLSVQWSEEKLLVNVSEEITSYGGGNAMEYAVFCELLEIAFSNPAVESFTLLIEGEEGSLPEGTQILDFTRERYEEEILNETDYFCDTKQR